MNTRLELNFIKSDGKSARITVPNADENMEAAEVKNAMDAVIATGVFAPGGADLVEAGSARFVTTETVDYVFEV